MHRSTKRTLLACLIIVIAGAVVIWCLSWLVGCATVSINTGEGGRTSADSGTGPSAPVVSDPAKVSEVTVITDDVHVEEND